MVSLSLSVCNRQFKGFHGGFSHLCDTRGRKDLVCIQKNNFVQKNNLETSYCAFQGASLQFEGLDRIGLAQF